MRGPRPIRQRSLIQISTNAVSRMSRISSRRRFCVLLAHGRGVPTGVALAGAELLTQCERGVVAKAESTEGRTARFHRHHLLDGAPAGSTPRAPASDCLSCGERGTED